MEHFQQQWTAFAARAEAFLDALLRPTRDVPEGLVEVLRYSVLGGGKRIRPVLCMAAAEAAQGPLDRALVAGCAIEMIHAYSLVHDDLPAMDNDDERRGQPTVHKKYDDATAILAGDGLQAEAFLLLSDPRRWPGGVQPEMQVAVIREIAHAAGNAGMVGGQYLDISARSHHLDLPGLRQLHRLKTGALIRAAVVCGGLTASVSTHELGALGLYGSAVGQIFQLTDDLIDFRTSQVDSDEAAVNFATILGEEAMQQEIQQQLGVALDAASTFAPRDPFLASFARAMASRER